MLQKLKNKLRLVRDKWLKIKKGKKYLIIAISIALTIGLINAVVNYEPIDKVENYEEIRTVANTMIKEKTTDVKFDSSKIDFISVKINKNGDKSIAIDGDKMETLYLTLDNNYQIKNWSESDHVSNMLFYWFLYVLFWLAIGFASAGILFGIYALFKKKS